MASVMLYLPVPLSRYISSCILCPLKLCTRDSYAMTESFVVSLPSASIAVIATVLNIEPGSLRSHKAWLAVWLYFMLPMVSTYSILPFFFCILDRFTMAFMSPVFVSIRIAQPAARCFSLSTRSNALWQMSSICVLRVVCTSYPFTGCFSSRNMNLPRNFAFVPEPGSPFR